VNFNKHQQRKEVKTMKYETPQLTALTPAIDAIQIPANKQGRVNPDSVHTYDEFGAYQDWE
jgi:hypothetical protein